MRSLSLPGTPDAERLLDPRRLARWTYLARLTVVAAIFVAAVSVWQRAPRADTLIATLVFAAAMIFTVCSAVYSEVYRRSVGRTFFGLQTLCDLALVTGVVHVTGQGESQFAALYILVIASAAVLLPVGDGLLVAFLCCVAYFADVIAGRSGALTIGVLLQLGVFALVAIGSGFIGLRLRQAGAGKAELAAELDKVRLEAADILAIIRSGIVTVDGAGRVLFANPAASTLLGVELAEDPRPVWDQLAAVAPELATTLRKTAQDRVRTTRAEAVVAAGGRRFPIGVTTTFAESGDEHTVTATAIFQDISGQKRLDALNLRAERLEAVAELSASLAHEIKNPLASIRSAVEQLARMPAGDADAPVLGDLIVREADRLDRLLIEFLDFARVRATRSDAVDVGLIARDAARLAGAHPDAAKGVVVDVSSADAPLVVSGDHDLLHRAAFNLALNAVQAAPAGGHVTLDVAPVGHDNLPVGIQFEANGVALRVTDDGPGIADEVRDRLFDPFFTTKPGGSGLGLAIVHRAIEAHRGIVFAENIGTGTRFTVLLPQLTPTGLTA